MLSLTQVVHFMNLWSYAPLKWRIVVRTLLSLAVLSVGLIAWATTQSLKEQALSPETLNNLQAFSACFLVGVIATLLFKLLERKAK